MKTLLFIFYIFFSATILASGFSDAELDVLKQKQYVLKLNPNDNSGTIVFDVTEDIDSVFNKIIAFKNYPSIIDEIEKVNIYFEDKNTIKVTFFVSEFFISFSNHVIHYINKEKNTVTWQLDKSKTNYFTQMNGSWRLQKINNKTRVFYSNQLMFDTWVPGFLKSYLFEDGLVNSTKWLRK